MKDEKDPMRLLFGFAFILAILMFSNLSPTAAKEIAKKEPGLDGEYDRTKTGLKKRGLKIQPTNVIR